MDQNYLQQISEHFNRGPALSIGWVLVAAGLVMVVVGGLALRHWWRTRDQRPTPLLSFLVLSGRLGLTLSDRWLLIRIALGQKLPTPITLLLSPATLRHHARAHASGMSRRRSDKLLRRVETVTARLFAPQAEGVVAREG